MIIRKKSFENSVGKGQNAANQDFVSFLRFLPKSISTTLSKLSSANTFSSLSQEKLSFYVSEIHNLKKKNSMGKGEIIHNEQFLFFPEHFYTIFKNIAGKLQKVRMMVTIIFFFLSPQCFHQIGKQISSVMRYFAIVTFIFFRGGGGEGERKGQKLPM